ncbi:hypothetical protein P3H80_21020 [Mycolicibacterium septicum]|uniref:hypothetical protein n=1 Tax=Mycolicibacterium septicum TaxID=98668 RepID=UPI0023E1C878|nr:hypothetical protein [Mycolicibacterium septicum]MDF3339932.1 hypothetical protein [Mycolicibacterium septicum]
MHARFGRWAMAASALALSTVVGAPDASAQPIATCTSDVVDGVEVDYCVGNPNAPEDTVTGVPGVNVDFEFGLGIGLG